MLLDKDDETIKKDSDSGVVIDDVDSDTKKIARSVSGAMRANTPFDGSDNAKDINSSDVSNRKQKRLFSNHRSVTRLKDLKYKRISKTNSRSLEELRLRLRFDELYDSSFN